MNTKQLVFGALAIAIVFFAIGFSVARWHGPRSTQQGTNPATNASSTVQEVSSDVKVPDADAADVAKDVAVPKVVSDAAPGVEAKFRAFDVKVENGSFSPSTIIVRQGDTANIKFTAVDRDYDFVQPDYGLSSKLLRGKTQLIEFAGVNPGKFTFYCSSCGGPSKGPIGYVVVVPR